ENIAHYLSEIKQPVLAIWGEKDFNFYFSASFTGRIPDYEFKIIPGIGHDLPGHAPEKSVELIINFIKKLEPRV
ncbi:MAG: alpha/beta hydrolase, partial [Candidatus Nealsonbacteria bacterium]|nr:alpha/beta hydrolase [Candidatus Nealsonbacteria bacterium]